MNEKEIITPLKKISLDDRLGLVKRNIDTISHIEVNQEKFKSAANETRPILFVCPAKVYELKEETGECIVSFENCLECGTCQIVSPDMVTWKNPRGKMGIVLKYG